jgi:hypothetical protein
MSHRKIYSPLRMVRFRQKQLRAKPHLTGTEQDLLLDISYSMASDNIPDSMYVTLYKAYTYLQKNIDKRISGE